MDVTTDVTDDDTADVTDACPDDDTDDDTANVTDVCPEDDTVAERSADPDPDDNASDLELVKGRYSAELKDEATSEGLWLDNRDGIRECETPNDKLKLASTPAMIEER